jgi:hypothetical protein
MAEVDKMRRWEDFEFGGRNAEVGNIRLRILDCGFIVSLRSIIFIKSKRYRLVGAVFNRD